MLFIFVFPGSSTFLAPFGKWEVDKCFDMGSGKKNSYAASALQQEKRAKSYRAHIHLITSPENCTPESVPPELLHFAGWFIQMPPNAISILPTDLCSHDKVSTTWSHCFVSPVKERLGFTQPHFSSTCLPTWCLICLPFHPYEVNKGCDAALKDQGQWESK